jgi:hypothetical protein
MSTLELIIIISLVAELGNLALLTLLVRIYWDNYKAIRSKFAVGLMFFASAFLLKSILTVAALFAFTFLSVSHADLEANLGLIAPLPLAIIEFIALAFLYKVTRE